MNKCKKNVIWAIGEWALVDTGHGLYESACETLLSTFQRKQTSHLYYGFECDGQICKLQNLTDTQTQA